MIGLHREQRKSVAHSIRNLPASTLGSTEVELYGAGVFSRRRIFRTSISWQFFHPLVKSSDSEETINETTLAVG